MKLFGVDVLDALARGFGIAFEPALIGSLVSYSIMTGLIETPMSWVLLEQLRDIVSKSVSTSIIVGLILGLLVYLKRLALGPTTSR